jgi:hypothetical protein
MLVIETQMPTLAAWHCPGNVGVQGESRNTVHAFAFAEGILWIAELQL